MCYKEYHYNIPLLFSNIIASKSIHFYVIILLIYVRGTESKSKPVFQKGLLSHYLSLLSIIVKIINPKRICILVHCNITRYKYILYYKSDNFKCSGDSQFLTIKFLHFDNY